MRRDNHHVEVTLDTSLDSIILAENLCVKTAESVGFGDDDCYRISMAVREGMVNAFRWGNQEQGHKKIHLRFEVQEGKLVIHIADQGCGFDPSCVPDPRADENLLKASGRGIFLMRAFMDEWEVCRSVDGGAELIMAKRLPHHELRQGRSAL
jgi:serine/threonine-protein kinase RsbW